MHAQRMPPHITTPFDDSAAMRLRRMGLLTPDGTPDERTIRPLAYVSAGLYYDQLCDSVESHESAAGVCQHIISEEAENRPRQALLALSMSYDTMRRGLPDPIWWLSGIKDIYTHIASVSTVLAGLMTAIAVVGAKLSNTQQKSDQAWDWLKRIWLVWAIINGIGAFIAYVVPLFQGLATLEP